MCILYTRMMRHLTTSDMCEFSSVIARAWLIIISGSSLSSRTHDATLFEPLGLELCCAQSRKLYQNARTSA